MQETAHNLDGLGRRRQTSIPPWQGSRLSSSLLAQPTRTPHTSRLSPHTCQSCSFASRQKMTASTSDEWLRERSLTCVCQSPVRDGRRQPDSGIPRPSDHTRHCTRSTSKESGGCWGDGERPTSNGIGQTCCCTRPPTTYDADSSPTPSRRQSSHPTTQQLARPPTKRNLSPHTRGDSCERHSSRLKLLHVPFKKPTDWIDQSATKPKPAPA